MLHVCSIEKFKRAWLNTLCFLQCGGGTKLLCSGCAGRFGLLLSFLAS